MTTIADDLPQHDQDVVQFWQTFNEMIQNVQDMEDKMRALSEVWRGEAYNDLFNHFNEDLGTFIGLREKLDDIYMSFNYCYRNYEKCEGDVSRLIGQIPT